MFSLYTCSFSPEKPTELFFLSSQIRLHPGQMVEHLRERVRGPDVAAAGRPEGGQPVQLPAAVAAERRKYSAQDNDWPFIERLLV